MYSKMSEGEAKEVTCTSCSEKVPSGNFCLRCGEKMNTEPLDGRTIEPHPPVQVSDASSSMASGLGTKASNGQSSVTSVAPTNNTCTTGSSQSNCSSPTNTESSSSYVDALKSSQQNGNHQSASLGNFTTNNPSLDKSTGHQGTSERRETGHYDVHVIPHNPTSRKHEGNSYNLHEVCFSCAVPYNLWISM